jgi:hypothetical protein
MRYHWIKDRVQDHEIKVSWVKGVDNFADFFNKALPVKEHQIVKHRYVSSVPDPSNPSLNKKARVKQQRALQRLTSVKSLTTSTSTG